MTKGNIDTYLALSRRARFDQDLNSDQARQAMLEVLAPQLFHQDTQVILDTLG